MDFLSTLTIINSLLDDKLTDNALQGSVFESVAGNFDYRGMDMTMVLKRFAFLPAEGKKQTRQEFRFETSDGAVILSNMESMDSDVQMIVAMVLIRTIYFANIRNKSQDPLVSGWINMIKAKYHAIFFQVMVLIDRVIGASRKTTQMELFSYYRAGCGTPLVSEEGRTTMGIRLGVYKTNIKGTLLITEEAKKAAKFCAAELDDEVMEKLRSL